FSNATCHGCVISRTSSLQRTRPESSCPAPSTSRFQFAIHNKHVKGRTAMKTPENLLNKPGNRRSFLKKGALAAGATMGAGLLGRGVPALGRERDENNDLTKGDVAILQLLLAAEIIETDLWTQ